MKLTDIEKKAKKLGIKVDKKTSKKDLIRAIQRTEGNFECFGTAITGSCDQTGCSWRVDCLK